jgi:hypothetical protein
MLSLGWRLRDWLAAMLIMSRAAARRGKGGHGFDREFYLRCPTLNRFSAATGAALFG